MNDLGHRLLFFDDAVKPYMQRHLANMMVYDPEGCFAAVEDDRVPT